MFAAKRRWMSSQALFLSVSSNVTFSHNANKPCGATGETIFPRRLDVRDAVYLVRRRNGGERREREIALIAKGMN